MGLALACVRNVLVVGLWVGISREGGGVVCMRSAVRQCHGHDRRA